MVNLMINLGNLIIACLVIALIVYFVAAIFKPSFTAKNRALKWGLMISVFYVLIMNTLWNAILVQEDVDDSIIMFITLGFLILPTLIAHLYDRKYNYNKQYNGSNENTVKNINENVEDDVNKNINEANVKKEESNEESIFKNPHIIIGIIISILYVLLSDEVYRKMSDDMFLLVTIFFLIAPTLIAYLYDKKYQHPKYYNYMRRIEKEKQEKIDKEKSYVSNYEAEDKEKFIVELIDFNNYKNLNFKNIKLWIYKEDKNLCLISKEYTNDIGKIEIPIKDILSFNRIGDVNSYTKISGGGGGGSSIGKAVVGGVIAGGAGAIIASRKKNEEIKSEHIIEDLRTTILKIKDNNLVYYLKFASNDYDTFLRLVPNKEVSLMDDKKSEIKDDVYSKIRELSKLKNEGILTEEEFSNKKQELLNNI